MSIRRFTPFLLCALATAATAQTPVLVPMSPATPPTPSQWRTVAAATGTGYETGTFGQSVDGGLRIACRPNGSAVLTVEIKGIAPSAGSRFLIVPTNRRGSQGLSFTAAADGTVTFPRARTDRQLARLWTALRGGTTATIRYGDGTFAVQSLIGAGRTLPPTPCR